MNNGASIMMAVFLAAVVKNKIASNCETLKPSSTSNVFEGIEEGE